MKRIFSLRRLLAAGLLLALLASGLLGFRLSYPLPPDLSGLEEAVSHAYHQGRPVQYPLNIKLHNSVALGRSRYVLLELDEDLGRVRLEQGPTGRWRLSGLAWGGGNFRFGVVEEEGVSYLLCGGRNTGGAIAALTARVAGRLYLAELPAGERFLVEVPLAASAGEPDFSIADVRFYDAQGRDITDQYELGGGSF